MFQIEQLTHTGEYGRYTYDLLLTKRIGGRANARNLRSVLNFANALSDLSDKVLMGMWEHHEVNKYVSYRLVKDYYITFVAEDETCAHVIIEDYRNITS